MAHPPGTLTASDRTGEPRRSVVGRTLDLLLGGTLLLLALPLMAVLALAVRVSSNGAALHRDRIRRRDGHCFELLSFRTTIDGASTSSHASLRAVIGAHEAPVTGVGAIMRATRTDRLPRLFNVVAGDVTMFG